MNTKYKYYISCYPRPGGDLNISYLWRQNQETKAWELSGNSPNNWTPYSEPVPLTPEVLFPNRSDWLTKREAKHFFPLATIP